MTYDANGKMEAVNMGDVGRDARIEIFFTNRFRRTPKSDPAYFAEWVKRINNGTAVAYADKESLDILKRWDLV